MRRAVFGIAVLGALVLATAVSTAAPDADGRLQVVDWLQAPDGGTVRQSADELGRAYTRPVSADGGVPEVRGTVAVTSPDGGIPEVSLGDLGTSAQPAEVVIGANSPGAAANDPIYCVPGDGTAAYSSANPQSFEQIVDGSAVGAASPMPVNVLSDGSAVGAANPLPTVPTDALHPAELTVSTTCLFLTLPSASALTPTAGQRYRLMARNDYVCIKAGSAPVSCEGVPMFAPDAPEAVAFAAIAEAAPDLYFFTPGSAAAIELCPLVEQ